MNRNTWLTWLVVALAWSAFWMGLYLMSGPTSSQGRFDRKAATALMMALPWIGGWLLYWVTAGSRQNQ